MTPRASRRRYTRQAFAQSGEEGQRTGTERTVGLHCDWLKDTSWRGSYISPLYDWQRGLLRRGQTEQKTTNMKLPVSVLTTVIIIIIIIIYCPITASRSS